MIKFRIRYQKMEDILFCLTQLKSWSDEFELIPCDSVESAAEFLSEHKLNLSAYFLAEFLLTSKFDFLRFWIKQKCLIQTDLRVFTEVFSKGSAEAFDFLVQSGIKFSEDMAKICFLHCCGLTRFDILESILKLEFFNNQLASQKFILEEVPLRLTRMAAVDALCWWKKTFFPSRSAHYFYLVMLEILTIDCKCLCWWKQSKLLETQLEIPPHLHPRFGRNLSPNDFERIHWCKSVQLHPRLEVPVQIPAWGVDTLHSKLYSDNGLFPEVSEVEINTFCNKGDIGKLRWVLANSSYAREGGITLHHTVKAVDIASNLGYLDILDAWVEAHEKWGVPFLYSSDSFVLAAQNYRQTSLNWWLESKFPLNMSLDCRQRCLEVFSHKEEHREKVKDWLQKVDLKYFEILRPCENLQSLPDEILLEISSFIQNAKRQVEKRIEKNP